MNPLRVAFWVIITTMFLFGLSGLVFADYTPPPETITVNSPKPLVCINGWVSDNQAHYIEAEAWALGFGTYWAEKNQTIVGCDVYFIRGDTDTWLNGKTYTFRGMSKSKAHKVLLGWKLAQNVTGECQVMDREGKWRDCTTGKATTGRMTSAVQTMLPEWRSGRSEALDVAMLSALILDGFTLGEELPMHPTHEDIARIVEGVWGAK